MEIWKNIEGFDGLYQVSNKGRVRSLNRKLADGRIWNERIMKTPLSAGYPTVSLRLNNVYVRERIHRLVGKAFVEGYKPEYVINHIDGNKLNNSLSNLEWATEQENSQHAVDTGLMTHDIFRKEVHQYTYPDLVYVQSFTSDVEAELATGIAKQNISKVTLGKRNHAGKFFWSRTLI